MANYRLLFYGSNTASGSMSIEVRAGESLNQLFIFLEPSGLIMAIDRDTAIKLVETINIEIEKIKES